VLSGAERQKKTEGTKKDERLLAQAAPLKRHTPWETCFLLQGELRGTQSVLSLLIEGHGTSDPDVVPRLPSPIKMASTPGSSELHILLKSLTSSDSPVLRENDVKILATSLVPTASRSARSLAFLCLSRYCDTVRKPGRTEEEQKDIVESAFRPLLNSTFKGDEQVVPEIYVPMTALLAVLFTLAPAASVKLLTAPIDAATDPPVDPLGILLEAAELLSPLQPILAELLAQAAGTKLGREIVRSRAIEWLRGGIDFGETKEVGVFCAVALSKLGREEAVPGQEDGQNGDHEQMDDLGLCEKMMSSITAISASSTAILPTLEGLSILSLQPRIKELLAKSPTFLASLLALSPATKAKGGSLPVTPRGSMDVDEKLFEPVETGVCYGVTTVLVNLTSRKPALSAEDQQIAKLRAMAISGRKGAAETEDDPLDSDEAVRIRVNCVLNAGCVSILRGLARAESRLVKEGLGRLCLNLVEDKANRPGFVRDGGFRVLSVAVRDLSETGSSKTAIPPDNSALLPAAQALAKLVITTPPHLLFPPPHLTTSLNALTPLHSLLLRPSSTLLQHFESLMALTNLASIDPSIASRIIDASVTLQQTDAMWRGSGREDKARVMTKVEEFMLDDNVMIRRAATELACNLANSQAGFSYFTGDGSTEFHARTQSRLKVLLVLTNVDDLRTRLAAGGALAVLTESQSACAALLSRGEYDTKSKRTVWSRALGMFDPEDTDAELDEDDQPIPVTSTTPPNLDLVHRAVIILLNLVTFTRVQPEPQRVTEFAAARKAGIEDKLLGVLRMKIGEELLQPTVECLKILKKYPGVA